MAKKINEGLMNEYLERCKAIGMSGKGWEKYLCENAGWLVELTNGTIFKISKPHIETRFCFGESGYDFDDACNAAAEARKNENLFRIRNRERLDEMISELSDEDSGNRLWVHTSAGVTDTLNIGRDWQFEAAEKFSENVFEIKGEDRKRLLEGYEIVREKFDKRITAYLKRYGLSKVRSWTYWLDA